MRWVFLFVMAATLPVWAEVMPSAVPLQSEQLPEVSHSQPAPAAAPFTVSGVTVRLDETEGFNRDAALTAAAKQALPLALGQLVPPLPATKASDVAASIGNPMTFVTSYKIQKEILVPAYQLTVDMVFDGKKLQDNFGSKVVTPAAQISATDGVDGDADVTSSSVADMPLQTLVIEASTAHDQDALFTKLEKAGLKPQWLVLAREGGRVGVSTALEGQPLMDKLQSLGLRVDEVDAHLVVRP